MKMNTKKWALAVAVLLLVVAVAVTAVVLTRPEGNELPASITITAEKPGEQGVEPDSAFLIRTGYAVREENLRAMLAPSPALEYSLQGSGKNWKLIPTAPLEENMVYSFAVINPAGETIRSFAFQTRSGLLVDDAYPRPGADRVEPTAGVELTLNSEIALADGFLELLPEAEGTLTVAGNTIRFVPTGQWQENCVYRVTLKAGLQALNGRTLAEDYTFSFQTSQADGNKRNEDLRLSRRGGGEDDFAESFLAGDPVVVEMYSSDMTGAKFTTTAYRFASAEDYAKELEAYDAYYRDRYGVVQDYRVNTTRLTQAAQVTEELIPKDRWWNQASAAFREGLEPGWYVLNVEGESPGGRPQFVQKLVQVCDVAAYLQSANGSTRVWLNNAANGQPMAGVRVQLQEMGGAVQSAGVTDADGLVVLESGKPEQVYLSVTDGGRLLYFSGESLAPPEEPSLSEQYYTAVYTDRGIYQPTDTLRFWGVVRPRDPQGSIPQAVYASLAVDGGKIANQRLLVDRDGIFTGELSFDELKPSWGEFSITDGGAQEKSYYSKGLQIEKFQKPPVVITVEQQKNWYYADEPIDFSVSAAYFDGTPMAGGRLRLTSRSLAGLALEPTDPVAEQAEQEPGVIITLDEQGRGRYTGHYQKSQQDYLDHWNAMNLWYEVETADAQTATVNDSSFIKVYPARIALEVKNDDPLKLTVRAAWLDEAKLNAEEPNHLGTPFEGVSGAPAEVEVTAEIIESRTVKIPDGEIYNPLLKKNVIQYRNEYSTETVETLQALTVGGAASFALDPRYQGTMEASYHVELTYDGGAGARVMESFYFGRNEENPYQVDRYELLKRSEDGNDHSYALDEKIPLAVYKNGEKQQNTGRVYYSVLQSNVLTEGFFTGESLELPFVKEYIPNLLLTGAYFDGRHIYEVESAYVNYDSTANTLEVQVTPSVESALPGDQVELTVTLTGADGKPKAGKACVGVVDEAVFALREQELDFAAQLYGSVFYTQVRQKASYVEYNLTTSLDTAGGMGGGGGDLPRTDFADTASFQTVEVGESGTATVKVKLPHNITTWRATAAAVTADLLGGAGKGGVIVTKPLYLMPLVTDTYLTGDDVSVSALPVSESLPQGTKAELTTTLRNEQGEELDRQSKTGAVAHQTAFTFGKLPVGGYTVELTTRVGEHQDTVRLPFAVAENLLTVRTVEKMALEQIPAVQSVRYPVVISLYDQRLEPYMEGIRVLSGKSGPRTETLTASYGARLCANELLPEEERGIVPKDGRLYAIQDYNSGVKPLPLGEPDAGVTAKLLFCAPEQINTEFAKQYLRERLKDPATTQDARVMTYAGLAALHEPVLLDLQYLLAQEDGLTAPQRLYLGAGLAILGDFEGAAKLYAQFPTQTDENGLRWVDLPEGDERTQATGAALLLCSIAGLPDADGMMRYLSAYEPPLGTAVLTDLEQLAYLRYFRFDAAEKAAFTYQKDGAKQTVELGPKGVQTLVLDKAGLAEAQIKTLRGELYANVEAVRTTNHAAPEESTGKVTVEKTLTPLGGGLYTAGMARVEVILTFAEDAEYGLYTISDLVPSGMRRLEYTGGREENLLDPRIIWNDREGEGQELRGYLYRMEPRDDGVMPLEGRELENPGTQANPVTDPNAEPEENDREYRFSYYVSCALPGEFVLESARVTAPDGTTAGIGQRGTVEILLQK